MDSKGIKHQIDDLLTHLPGGNKRAKTVAIEGNCGRSAKCAAIDKLPNTFENKGYVHGPIDSVFGQRRAFPVSIDTANVDMDKIPESAEEYLSQVRREASEGVHQDEDEEEDFVYIKRGESPAQEQQGTGDDDYKTMERYLQDYIESRRIYDSYRQQLHEIDGIELPQTAREWKKFIWEVSCQREYIAQIVEEGLHMKLLVYFTKWMWLKMDSNFTEWLLGILSAVDNPLSSSDLSVVRQLGKKAARQLAHGSEEAIHLRVVAIVSLFFKQKDITL